MIGPPRSLPLRVPLHPGEAFDSWLTRLALRNGGPLRRIAPALGLGEQVRGWRHFTWIRGIRAEQLRVIERHAGLKHGALDAAVLDRFEPLGWRPVAGSRFCPSCLEDSSGAWPIRWQLPYALACAEHRSLLLSACPACGLAPHLRVNNFTGTLPAYLCASLPRGADDICRADLRECDRAPMGGTDPRLAAQSWVDARLDRMDEPAVADLRDLGTLARWFRTRVAPIDVADLGEDTVRAITDYRNPELHLPARRRHPDSILVEAALTRLAVGIIAAPDPQTRHRRFTPLFRDVGAAARNQAAPQSPTVLSRKRLVRLSVPLQQALLAACDRHLPVSERLRYYTATTLPRLTEPGSTRIGDRARWIPGRLWQDWLVRFAPPKGFHPTAIAVDLPAALLLPGNPARNIRATGELRPWRNNISIALSELADTYPDVLQAICNLADHLDTHGGAIDYRRRRETFADYTLSEDDWLDICTRARTGPGLGRKLVYARMHLFSLLTGSDVITAETLPGGPDDFARSSFNTAFRQRIPLTLRTAFTDHAARLLETADIDEPVSWSPPADCVDGLKLPGPDPDSLTPADITPYIEKQRLSPTATAAALGTTIEHIRYLIEQLERIERRPKSIPSRDPKPKATTPRKPRPRPTGPSRTAKSLFTREFLKSRLIDQGMSAKQLAAETGFGIVTVRRYADLHGLDLARRPIPLRMNEIDPDWFRHQTEVLKRPNSEIAAELGTSHETVRRFRIELGIEPGRLGIYHERRFPGLPEDIRSAVEGQQDGWTRLYRFRQTMAFPSMNIAAQRLGYYTSNLNLQVNRLEQDIGAKLIERGHRYQPMKPTDQGQRLLDDLELPEVRELLDHYAQKARIIKPNRRKSSDTTQT